jgi:hypothetical protein
MTRLPELESRLDTLTTQILVPLRASKDVDSQAMNGLYELADDLAAELGESPRCSARLSTPGHRMTFS